MADTLRRATRIAERACQSWPCITAPPVLFMHRENSVFKVATASGFAALRVHRSGYHQPEAIRSELVWMAHLAANGLKVPKPLANGDGAHLSEITMDGQVYFVDLLIWLDGTPLGNSMDALGCSKPELAQIFFNLGAAMAQMHSVSDAWTMPEDFVRHAWDREGFVGDNPFWGAFWNASELSAGQRDILFKVRRKAAIDLDTLQRAGADYGLIHADFVRQNILLAGTDVRLIDFDDSGFGFRMYDLATALVKNRAEPHYDVIKASLFDGYRSRRTISEGDEQYLDLFLALRDFAYLGWMDARRGEPGVEERMPQIRAATMEAAHGFLETF